MTRKLTIDSDVHCTLPSFEALFPYLGDYWPDYIKAGRISLPSSNSAAYPPGAPTTATPEARSTSPDPGPSLAALREHVLDRHDVKYAVLNCMTGVETLRNVYFAADVARAINDWLAAEWLDEEPRLRASIVVCSLDIDAAVDEIEHRSSDDRFVQVLLPVRSDAAYGNVRYHRLHEAAARHGLPIALHAWGMSATPPTPFGFCDHYIEDYVAHRLIVQAHLTSLVLEGVFEKWPDLRVVLLECGFTWLPSYLWRFDKDWKGLNRETPWVREEPSTYIRRHTRASIEPLHGPPDVAQLLDVYRMVGWREWLLFATDYPHDHGPGRDEFLALLPDEDRQAVMGLNAAAFYAD